LEKKRILIVGCGTAALSALKQIRKVNSQAEVKLVSMESHLPYSPTSLPYVISGRMKESEIAMAAEDFFEQMDAVWLRGKKVERVDAAEGTVILDSGEKESFDALLIATGSEPVMPQIPGLSDGQALVLRTLDQARDLAARMEVSKTAIVLGAGLIGMHVAQCLAEKGVQVKVVEMLPRILPAYFDEDASGMIQGVLERHGITFVTGRKADRVTWKKTGVEVTLKSGEALEADLLLVATGVTPRTAFLEGSGIEINGGINGGILVDNRMRTSVTNIFAAGDVAAAQSFLAGEHGINAILPNAAEQGKVAGSNMAGQAMEYEGWLPMNAFKFFGHLAVSVGKASPSAGDEVLAGSHEENGYRRLICSNGLLLGATFIDTDVNAGVFQYLIRKRVNVGPHKEILLRAPREASVWLMQDAERKATVSLEE
jgi:phenylglyoxylate dehydrogenase epsilon subunit